jgi:catechol 2,3-dioxygenase-like lactoylglutathione lyase family enzyme
MSFKLNHLHLKTPDPRETADWYVTNLGARIVSESANGGFRLDLHGLPLNVTGFIDSQSHDQVYGIEHIAIDTDDIDGTVARLKV